MIDTGSGPAVVLLHGFPHTPRLWDRVVPDLAREHRVIAPDLMAGGDAEELADGIRRRLDAEGIATADVVAIDAGVPVAVVLALGTPQRVRRLAVMESLVGRLPGAERFLAGGAPWWFGFHQVPELPEYVLVGHEDAYIRWFLRAGTHDGRGIDERLAAEFVAAYTGTPALAAAFEHYRAMPANAARIDELTRSGRLTMPVLAIGAAPVGPALAAQLRGIADDLAAVQFDDCGHLVPLDAPDRLLAELRPFLGDD